MEDTNKLPEKQWYIATTYSGHEQKAAENIRRRIESMNLKDYVFRIVVAEEEVQAKDKDGKPLFKKNKETGIEEPKMKTINLYPGYVFVEMIMTDESWFMIRNTPSVTGIADDYRKATHVTCLVSLTKTSVDSEYSVIRVKQELKREGKTEYRVAVCSQNLSCGQFVRKSIWKDSIDSESDYLKRINKKRKCLTLIIKSWK